MTTTTISDDRRALIDLLPQVLRGWSRGWDGLPPAVAAIGLAPPAASLLRALVQERDAGVSLTRKEMQRELGNPCSTVWPMLDHLPALVAANYLTQDSERYTVTDAGRRGFRHVEAAKDAYLATLHPIPSDDLERLLDELDDIADRLWNAPEPHVKAHAARPRRTPPPADAAPMVRLIHLVYCLWMARDDAHNAAWRAAGFYGPTFDLLSRVWSGEAITMSTLAEAVRQFQRPEDVQRGVDKLITAGYLIRNSDILTLTEQGRAIRDAIEVETDRIFFAPWPPLTATDVRWRRTTVEAVIADLGS